MSNLPESNSDNTTGDINDRLCALAHELNNGLAVITGQCELILDHDGPEGPPTERVRCILDLALRLAKKINTYQCRTMPSKRPAAPERHASPEQHAAIV